MMDGYPHCDGGFVNDLCELSASLSQTGDIADVAMGMDIVSIERIRSLLAEYPDRFRELGFSSEERTYCESRALPAQHYAARWAIKEAFIKTVSEWESDFALPFRNIAVVRDPEPRLTLHGAAKDVIRERSRHLDAAPKLSISLSHDIDADCALGAVFLVFV